MYKAKDIPSVRCFFYSGETTTCMEHQILSQTTFSKDYGKPATSDLLITNYLKTEVRSFVWSIVDFVATQYIIAKALKEFKNQIKKMTFTHVLKKRLEMEIQIASIPLPQHLRIALS